MAHADGAQRVGDRLGRARSVHPCRRRPPGPVRAPDAPARDQAVRPANSSPWRHSAALMRSSPMIPSGRKASTSTMIRKVKTTP